MARKTLKTAMEIQMPAKALKTAEASGRYTPTCPPAKARPKLTLASPVAIPNDRKGNRGKKTVIIDKKPAAQPHRQVVGFKEPTVSYQDIFGAYPTKTTVGAYISIIRAYLHREGVPEIPERISVTSFATVAARFLLPRHAWPLFNGKVVGDKDRAVKFLRKWAQDLLFKSYGEVGKPQNALPSWIMPEIAAFYDPQILKGRTA
jgi:hypothetical protein